MHLPTSIVGQYGRWEGLTTIVCYFVLYLAAHNVSGKRELIRPLFVAILISSTLVSVIAIIEYLWTNPFLLFTKVYCSAGFGEPNAFETGRSMATFGNAAFLAAYLTLVLPILFAYLSTNRKDIIPRPLAYFALLYISIALLLTFGRAAWIGAVAGITLVGWLSWDHIKKYRAHIIAVFLIFVLAFTIAQSVGYSYSAADRVASIFKIEGSALTRVQMWEASLPLVSERPLLGSGPDTFKYVFGKYKPEGWVEHITDPLVDKAHNDALQVAVTHGALGLVAYLWILIVLIWSGARKVRSLKGSQEIWLAVGMLGAALGYFIQLQFSFSHFTTAPYFWIFMGLISGQLLTNNRDRTVVFKTLERQRIPVVGVLAVVTIGVMIVSTAPLIADMHFAKGRELESLNKLPEAVSEYRAASSINGLEPTYRISLAEALIRLGTSTGNDDYVDLGSSAFTEAARMNPIDEQVYFRAGGAFLEAGRKGNPDLLRASIEQHNRGLDLNPVMVDAYLDIGVAHAYLNNYDDAISAWFDALTIEPDNNRAYFNLGWAYEHKGERMRAKEAYLKAYQLNPKMIEAKAAYDRL